MRKNIMKYFVSMNRTEAYEEELDDEDLHPTATIFQPMKPKKAFDVAVKSITPHLRVRI